MKRDILFIGCKYQLQLNVLVIRLQNGVNNLEQAKDVDQTEDGGAKNELKSGEEVEVEERDADSHKRK